MREKIYLDNEKNTRFYTVDFGTICILTLSDVTIISNILTDHTIFFFIYCPFSYKLYYQREQFYSYDNICKNVEIFFSSRLDIFYIYTLYLLCYIPTLISFPSSDLYSFNIISCINCCLLVFLSFNYSVIINLLFLRQSSSYFRSIIMAISCLYKRNMFSSLIFKFKYAAVYK